MCSISLDYQLFRGANGINEHTKVTRFTYNGAKDNPGLVYV